MREQLDLLYQLQLADTKIDDATRRLKGLDDGSVQKTELEAQQDLLAQMQAGLKSATTGQLNRELELGSTEDERKARWGEAYGGTISDPKQLRSLEQKIEELQRRKDTLEDALLQLYDEIEEQTARVEVQKSKVAKLEKQWKATVAEFRKRRAELREAIAEGNARRAELVPQLEPGLLADYEGIRIRNGGLGLAVLDGEMCRGCRTTMAHRIIDAVKAKETIVRCETCRRFLYAID